MCVLIKECDSRGEHTGQMADTGEAGAKRAPTLPQQVSTTKAAVKEKIAARERERERERERGTNTERH